MLEALKAILLENTISTQKELELLLQARGFEVNQSKISRLLRKLGAVKVPHLKGKIIYSLPREIISAPTKKVLSHLVLNIKFNEAMIIIHTNPGSASFIARLLDHEHEKLDILGTVAGDDTIFIAPKSLKKIETVQENIHFFLGTQPLKI